MPKANSKCNGKSPRDVGEEEEESSKSHQKMTKIESNLYLFHSKGKKHYPQMQSGKWGVAYIFVHPEVLCFLEELQDRIMGAFRDPNHDFILRRRDVASIFSEHRNYATWLNVRPIYNVCPFNLRMEEFESLMALISPLISL